MKPSGFKCVTLNHKISRLVQEKTDEKRKSWGGKGRREGSWVMEGKERGSRAQASHAFMISEVLESTMICLFSVFTCVNIEARGSP